VSRGINKIILRKITKRLKIHKRGYVTIFVFLSLLTLIVNAYWLIKKKIYQNLSLLPDDRSKK
jgi:hypothetical protein